MWIRNARSGRLAGAGALAWLAAAGVATGTPAPRPLVIVVPLTGMVHSASADLVLGGIARAAERDATLVVVEIATPGGYMSSMERIQAAILASRAPVAALVAPAGSAAASAGFFILMTADVAAMAPGTSTGSAHPVMVGGGGGDGGDEKEQKGETVLEKKIEHHAAAQIRTIVKQRGRNVEAAERAVRESVSFTDEEALALGLVEHVEPSVEALVRRLDGTMVRRMGGRVVRLDLDGAAIERIEPTFRQRLLAVIALPQVAYLLFLLGLIGIYTEFTHPGLILPGVIGSLSLLVALYATTVLSVNITGVLLIVLAVALFLLEIKLTSFGILGAGGVVALVLGSLMLFEGPMPGVELGLGSILPATVVVAAVVLALASVVLRSRAVAAVTGAEGLVGARGRALSAVGAEGGRVFVEGEYWNAVSREPIVEGARVRVRAVRDLLLEVEGEPLAGVAARFGSGS